MSFFKKNHLLIVLTRIDYLLTIKSYSNTGTTVESSSADSCKKSDERKTLRLNIPQPEFMDRQHSNVSATSFISSDVSSIVDMDEYDSEDDMKVESEEEDVDVHERSNWPYPKVPPGASTKHADTLLKNNKRKRRRSISVAQVNKAS